MLAPETLRHHAALAFGQTAVDLPEARHQAQAYDHHKHVHVRPNERRQHVHRLPEYSPRIRIGCIMENVRQLQHHHVLNGIVGHLTAHGRRVYGRDKTEQVLNCSSESQSH